MSEKFDSLDLVTDWEMEAIVQHHGMVHWMQEIVKLAIKRAMDKEILELKEHLDAQFYGNRIPQEAKDFINRARAEFMIENNGKTFQMADKDDRLWENMDNAVIHLWYWKKWQDFRESASKFSEDMIKDWDGHMAIGSIFMRTIPETLKILIFYLKIKDLEDIKKLVKWYQWWLAKMWISHEKDGDISYWWDEFREKESLARYEWVFWYNSYFWKHFDEIKRDFTTVSEDISTRRMLWYIEKFKISDIDTFIQFLFGEVYTYGFIFLVDKSLVNYFLESHKIDSVDKFLEFIKNNEVRYALVKCSESGSSIENTLKYLKKFRV